MEFGWKKFFQLQLESLICRADILVKDANNVLFNSEVDITGEVRGIINQATQEFYNKLMEIVVKIQISQFDSNSSELQVMPAATEDNWQYVGMQQVPIFQPVLLEPFTSPSELTLAPRLRDPYNFSSDVSLHPKQRQSGSAFNIFFETNTHQINEASKALIYTINRLNKNSFIQVTTDELEQSPNFDSFNKNSFRTDFPPGLVNFSEERRDNGSVVHNKTFNELKKVNPELYKFLTSTPPQCKRFSNEARMRMSPKSENSTNNFEIEDYDDTLEIKTGIPLYDHSDCGDDFSTTSSVNNTKDEFYLIGKQALMEKQENMRQRREELEKQKQYQFHEKYSKVFDYAKKVNMQRDQTLKQQYDVFRSKLEKADCLKQKQQQQRVQQATNSLQKIEDIKRKRQEQKDQLLQRILKQQEENEHRRQKYLFERRSKSSASSNNNSVIEQMKILWLPNSNVQLSALTILHSFKSSLNENHRVIQFINRIILNPDNFDQVVNELNTLLTTQQLKSQDLVEFLQLTLILLFYQNDLHLNVQKGTYESFVITGQTDNDLLQKNAIVSGILEESQLLYNVFLIIQLLQLINQTKTSISLIIEFVKELDDLVQYDVTESVIIEVKDPSLKNVSTLLLNNFFEILLLKFDFPYLPNDKFVNKVRQQALNLQIYPKNNLYNQELMYFYDQTSSLQLSSKILQVILAKGQVQFTQSYYQELFLMVINQIAQIVLSPQSYVKELSTKCQNSSIKDLCFMYQDLSSLLQDLIILSNILLEHYPINIKLYQDNDVTMLQQELKEIIFQLLGPKIYNFSEVSQWVNFLLPYYVFLPQKYNSLHLINIKQPFKLMNIEILNILPTQVGVCNCYDLLGEFSPKTNIQLLVNFGLQQSLLFTSQILRLDLIESHQLKFFFEQFLQLLPIEAFLDIQSNQFIEEIRSFVNNIINQNLNAVQK